jgi:hypothetical protein
MRIQQPTIHFLDGKYFINGEHIDDITNEHKVLLLKGKTVHHDSYTKLEINLVNSVGCKHSPTLNLPGHIKFHLFEDGTVKVLTAIYYNNGHVHNCHGPAKIEFAWNGEVAAIEYWMNNNPIDPKYYFADPFNPTNHELFVMTLSN